MRKRKAGAGSLGSVLLLSLTPLTASEVVGTDLSFGLVLALAGSAIQLGAGNYDPALLIKLVIGGLCGAFIGSFLATPSLSGRCESACS